MTRTRGTEMSEHSLFLASINGPDYDFDEAAACVRSYFVVTNVCVFFLQLLQNRKDIARTFCLVRMNAHLKYHSLLILYFSFPFR